MRARTLYLAFCLAPLASPAFAETGRWRQKREGGFPRRNRRQRAGASLVARLPARRPHARHRAPGPAAHSRQRREIIAAGRRRARRRRGRPGRLARHRARARFRREPHRLFQLRRAARAGGRGQPEQHFARERPLPRGRRQGDARRREGDFPPGARCRGRPAFRLAHRHRPRRHAVPDHGRAQPQDPGAGSLRPSRQGDPRLRRRLGAARQSLRRTTKMPSPKSGPTATATSRPRRSTRRAASCGSSSTGPRAATRSTCRRRARITAGR